MLDNRTSSLVRVSMLASRPRYRNELIEELRKIKESSSAARTELYEVVLQSYLFAGFPAALESARALSKVFGSGPDQVSDPDEMILEYRDHLENGEILYKEVYAANAEKVRTEMIRLSPELAAWAMIEGYGKTLSREEL